MDFLEGYEEFHRIIKPGHQKGEDWVVHHQENMAKTPRSNCLGDLKKKETRSPPANRFECRLGRRRRQRRLKKTPPKRPFGTPTGSKRKKRKRRPLGIR